MKKVIDFPKTNNLPKVDRPYLVPDVYGMNSPTTFVHFSGSMYALNGLAPTANCVSGNNFITVFDKQKGSLCIITCDLMGLSYDIEDMEIVTFDEYILAVSDSRISNITAEGIEVLSFSDLNQYFIDVDYTSASRGSISFTIGSGEVVKHGISDLFALNLGQLIPVTKLRRAVESSFVHKEVFMLGK